MNPQSLAHCPLPLVSQLLSDGSTLRERLLRLHDQLLERLPAIDRIAFALYDADNDLLKTCIDSTRTGKTILGYEFNLSNSSALRDLGRTGEFRILDEIHRLIKPDIRYSAWLLEQGYQSSFTVPLYHNSALLGIVFFDSLELSAFNPIVQRDLVLYCSLIHMAISSELAAIHTIMRTARIARDLANMRDFETGAHLERMARYSRLIALAIAPIYQLSEEFIEHVHLFAPLHDIGKIGIPDSILLKPGKLDPDERKIMDTHVDKGIAVIETMISEFGLQQISESSILMNIVRCHHEMLDGSGYPQGLRGADIPIEARIVSVADIFDALTFARPYKAGWSFERALLELQRMAADGKLDKDCVGAVEQNLAAFAAIAKLYRDARESDLTPPMPA